MQITREDTSIMQASLGDATYAVLLHKTSQKTALLNASIKWCNTLHDKIPQDSSQQNFKCIPLIPALFILPN